VSLGPGSAVGDYILGAPIADGSLGSVWRAREPGLDRDVALKVIYSEVRSPEATVRRVERDLLKAARIGHPALPELYEVGRLPDGSPFIAMELIDGLDLAWMVACGGPLPGPTVVSLLTPIVDALTKAHAIGLVHCDVKASHIVSNEVQGDGGRVKLLDFGTARLLDRSRRLPSTESRVAATAMSPEQIRGDAVSLRTDIYGLGATLFHLLTGGAPFADVPTLDAMHLHLEGRRPRPSDTALVPAALDDIVAKAMAIDANERYESAQEFLADVRRALDV
jgi:eukaryotic-like serine/threonine-protein kinase